MPTISRPDSPRAIAARLNGAKSKGPKTEEGKARSSRNALKHGLSAENEIIAPGDLQGFERHQASLFEHYQPRNTIEIAFVERIAACTWRLRRVVALESALLGADDPDAKYVEECRTLGHVEHRFMNLNRYETALERSLYRAIKALKESKVEFYETNPTEAPGADHCNLPQGGGDAGEEVPQRKPSLPSNPSAENQPKESQNEPKPYKPPFKNMPVGAYCIDEPTPESRARTVKPAR